MRYMGLDPGVGGGIAMIEEDGTPVWAVGMPETERDLWDRLTADGDATQRQGLWRAMIERVSAVPGMPPSNAFRFGSNYGALRMALVGAGIPFEMVGPTKWMTALGCSASTGARAIGERRRDKNVSKAKAQELFPSLKITHKTADALLVAEYCRRHDRGLLSTPRSATVDSDARPAAARTTLF